MGSLIPGTGNPIDLGNKTSGTYTIIGTSNTGGCIGNMSNGITVNSSTAPTAFAVTGGGNFCSGPGVSIGLSGSQAGVNYQLFRGLTAVGSAITGTGGALDFGNQTTGGTYTVVATNNNTSCMNNMTGSAIVTAGSAPTAFNVTGGGVFCSGPGVSVGLSGSETGVSYQLLRGATSVGAALTGAGGPIDFGNQTTSGTYTVVATNSLTSCINNMTGNASVTAGTQPAAFSVTGGGSFCNGLGVSVGLSGSQTGVNYQLFRGVTSVGAPASGTGGPIDFGNQTTGGTYTVVATNAITTCVNNMTGNAVVSAGTPPTAFSVTGGGPYCSGPGVAVGLSGSQTGVNYQLFIGGSPVGSAVGGTGNALSFGNQTTIGTYTVGATNTTTLCTNNMTGSASITSGSQPTAFSVTGGGSYCSGPGVAVGLSGSQTGVNYQLFIGGSPVGSAVGGTGNALSFGNQTTIGTYTVGATNTTTLCTNNMTGSASITSGSQPTAFSVTGGGPSCSGPGIAIGLSGSQSGVNYQLLRGGSPIGSAVAGTGNALSFGNQTTIGTYTIGATNTTTLCTNNMTGSSSITSGTAPTVTVNSPTRNSGGPAATITATPSPAGTYSYGMDSSGWRKQSG